MTIPLNHVHLSLNPAYTEIYGKTLRAMISQICSEDFISVSNCHSKLFASSSFCWFQWGLYQVLKQSLRTIFPHIA